MNLRDNPLDSKETKRYDDIFIEKMATFGMFMLECVWGGIRMIAIAMVMICGLALFITALLGTPMFAVMAFEAGYYVLGGGLVVLTLIFYGMGFNAK